MILYLVLDHEGKPSAAYPREIQAKVYASGHYKPCTIVAGEFTAFQQSVHLTGLCVCPEDWSIDIHGNCSNCGLAKTPRK